MAIGKHAKAISDRSGMEFPYSEMVKEWNGSFVHRSEYEEKHPQLELRTRGGESEGLLNARPDRTENIVSILLGPDPFETIAASSGIINVFEQGHGRSTSDTVRFRGAPSTSATYNNPKGFDGIAATNLAKAAGYSITVGKRDSSGNVTQTEDYYYFTVDTNTATSGNISGGGENCSAGPATLTA
jgi:hypothetical protein|tara:strand:+ start:622 stop:1176 length:555 start_codon:yes stop_codon:yes gene_type:complete